MEVLDTGKAPCASSGASLGVRQRAARLTGGVARGSTWRRQGVAVLADGATAVRWATVETREIMRETKKKKNKKLMNRSHLLVADHIFYVLAPKRKWVDLIPH
jgi:hypothetical protein